MWKFKFVSQREVDRPTLCDMSQSGSVYLLSSSVKQQKPRNPNFCRTARTGNNPEVLVNVFYRRKCLSVLWSEIFTELCWVYCPAPWFSVRSKFSNFHNIFFPCKYFKIRRTAWNLLGFICPKGSGFSHRTLQNRSKNCDLAASETADF